MERNTPQKQIIISYLRSVKTHPTAEEVYNNIIKNLPNISKGTVYRILNNFEEKGELQKIDAEATHYDADISEHAHLVCRKCKKVYDVFDYKSKDELPEQLEAGKIESRQVIFKGVCSNCIKNK